MADEISGFKLSSIGRTDLPEGFAFSTNEERDNAGRGHRSVGNTVSSHDAPAPSFQPEGEVEGARPRKRGKPMTPSRVRNIAEYYVSQREASAQMVRDVLWRRTYQWLRDLDEEDRARAEQETSDLIEAEITRLKADGIVDDSRFTRMKVRSARERGKAARRIIQDLAKKGINKEMVEDALREAASELSGDRLDDPELSLEEADLDAAETFARKKRIGPYRRSEMPQDFKERQKVWRREAGAMARAGFGLDKINDILGRDPEPDPFAD